MKTSNTRLFTAALALSAATVLTACGESDIAKETQQNEAVAGGDEECGTVDMAINPWVGYEANAHVVGRVAESQLGCQVNYKDLDEQVSWKGFGTDEVDVVIENWGHPELAKKYIESEGGNGSAQEAGLTGNKGIIGWFVPPWMAEKYPDITDWENLDKYSDMFKTPESGDKGTLYDGDPGFVTNDEALVKNLDLNYKVVFTGSETALIEGFRTAEQNKTPYLGYFYDPQWFLSEVPLVKINLPEYEEGCDADAEKVDCDYPVYDLNKIVATDFVESASPAYELVKNFQWTNEDQNLVAKYIAQDGMDPDEAADKWIAENQDVVDGWLGK